MRGGGGGEGREGVVVCISTYVCTVCMMVISLYSMPTYICMYILN